LLLDSGKYDGLAYQRDKDGSSRPESRPEPLDPSSCVAAHRPHRAVRAKGLFVVLIPVQRGLNSQVQRVDQALYQAKESGGIVVAW